MTYSIERKILRLIGNFHGKFSIDGLYIPRMKSYRNVSFVKFAFHPFLLVFPEPAGTNLMKFFLTNSVKSLEISSGE